MQHIPDSELADISCWPIVYVNGGSNIVRAAGTILFEPDGHQAFYNMINTLYELGFVITPNYYKTCVVAMRLEELVYKNNA